MLDHLRMHELGRAILLMAFLLKHLPVPPPIEDEQSKHLLYVLRALAYAGLLATAAFLAALFIVPFPEYQATLVNVQRLVLTINLFLCVWSLYLLSHRNLRLGSTLQIFSLWLALTTCPDLMGVNLYIIAANHVALAICVGALLGWTGALTLGLGGFVYLFLQHSQIIADMNTGPLLLLNDTQILVIEMALYALMLVLTVLLVFNTQRRTEIGKVTAEALEVVQYGERQLAAILSSMADLLIVVNLDGTILRTNSAAQAVLGYTEGELYGEPLKMLMEGAEDQAGIETLIGVRRSEAQTNRCLKTKDGRLLPVSLSTSPLTDSSGETTGMILVAQDLTELEQARAQLSQINARFSQAILFSHIGVFEYDMASGVVTTDELTREILRTAGIELFTHYDDYARIVSDDDARRITAALDEYRRGARSQFEVEFRVNSDDGPRWMMARGAMLDANSSRLIGTYTDITRRKRAEIELARRDAVLRAVTLTSEAFLHSGSWQLQVETLLRLLGEAVDVSRVYVFRVHYSPFGRLLWSQLYEWCAPGIVPEVDNPDLQNLDVHEVGFARWHERMSQRLAVYGLIDEFPDSEREFLSTQDIRSLAIMPIYVQDEWWGMIGFDDCVNARLWGDSEIDALQLAADNLGAAIHRERVERELETNHDFLTTIMDNLGQGVAVVDGTGRLLFVNPAMAELIGVERDDLVGQMARQYYDEATAPQYDINFALRRLGHASTYTARLRRADGGLRDVIITGVTRVVDGQPDGSYAVLTDITERRHLEQRELRLSLEREQMRILSDFIRDASHDFRTPLSIIQTSVYLLKRKAESPDQISRLETVGEQAQRLSRLIDGLLTMLELDKSTPSMGIIDVNVLVRNAVDRAIESVQQAGLEIVLKASDEPVYINGEEGSMLKALSNLIDNAITFTPHGGTITVEVVADEDTVRINVHDTGIGIDPSEHTRIFERLYKVDKARSSNASGLGMGLPITKRIIDLHNGTIRVDSAFGQGSVFTVELARQKKAAASAKRGYPSASSPITEDVKLNS